MNIINIIIYYNSIKLILKYIINNTLISTISITVTSLAPPLRRAGGCAEESGDTATEFVAERNAIISSY